MAVSGARFGRCGALFTREGWPDATQQARQETEPTRKRSGLDGSQHRHTGNLAPPDCISVERRLCSCPTLACLLARLPRAASRQATAGRRKAVRTGHLTNRSKARHYRERSIYNAEIQEILRGQRSTTGSAKASKNCRWMTCGSCSKPRDLRGVCRLWLPCEQTRRGRDEGGEGNETQDNGRRKGRPESIAGYPRQYRRRTRTFRSSLRDLPRFGRAVVRRSFRGQDGAANTGSHLERHTGLRRRATEMDHRQRHQSFRDASMEGNLKRRRDMEGCGLHPPLASQGQPRDPEGL